MTLQRLDGVVDSVLEVRGIFTHMDDSEYAEWYEAHFMVSAKRVLSILQANKGETV